jgi:hypothetical protein
VLVLGSALPGLAAAVRMAMGGLRVLVAEEEAAARTPELLREPFFLPGGPVVDGCLRALGLPLIERRSLETDEIAYQVLLPESRVDVGSVALTADELVAWGLAKPDRAGEMLRGLAEAGSAEGDGLLETDLVKRGALRIGRGQAGGPHARGLPLDLVEAEGDLARFFEAQWRILAGGAGSKPTPEAMARLLGASLAGGARFRDPGTTLRSLLRRRLESLHGEIRTLGCPFGMVELGEASGVARIGPNDAWLGRALVLNAPPSRIAEAMRGWEQDVPRLLKAETPTHRRLAIHLRTARESVPEPLSARAIWWDGDGEAPIEIAQYPSGQGSHFSELVLARTVEWGAGDAEETARMLEAVESLIPYDEGHAKLGPLAPRPLWDDDTARQEPARGHGWPEPVDVRTAGRKAVFQIPRAEVGDLGVEGELLLGWRAGDAIREGLL